MDTFCKDPRLAESVTTPISDPWGSLGLSADGAITVYAVLVPDHMGSLTRHSDSGTWTLSSVIQGRSRARHLQSKRFAICVLQAQLLTSTSTLVAQRLRRLDYESAALTAELPPPAGSRANTTRWRRGCTLPGGVGCVVCSHRGG